MSDSDKPQFTPGPWIACVNTSTGAAPGKSHVCYTDQFGIVQLVPQTPANAALQAAAPELYWALRTLLLACEDSLWPVIAEHMMPLNVARAALSKASQP